MINFDILESNLELLSKTFESNTPFEHIVIDDFCHSSKIENVLSCIPDPIKKSLSKSNDYVFAKNKFETAEFDKYCAELKSFKDDLLSDRFASWLSSLVGEDIFIDPGFHGGGLHQGGTGSFLDMHVDFNYHPLEPKWFRNVNILLYLNKDWLPEYGGELCLQHGSIKDNPVFRIEPLFNRAVIMFTRDYTVHGYDAISFPSNSYRRSIAAYGYSISNSPGVARTTTWFPKKGRVKKWLGLAAPHIVKLKHKIFD